MRSVLAGLRRLVLPWGAGPGKSRMVLGGDIPADLRDFYLNGADRPFTANVIAVQLFYNSANNYFYLAHLEIVTGTLRPALAFGVSVGGTIAQRFILSGHEFPTNYLADVVFLSNTGAYADGVWTNLTPLNGWVNRAGYQSLRVKRVPSPAATCMIVGNFNPAGTTADGTVLCVLPPQFRPTNAVGVPIQTSTTVSAGQSPTLDIQTNGNCLLYGVRGAFTGFSAIYSLDA